MGQITPETASRILHDRSNSSYINESTIANLSAFHSVVIHPASRTLWHSTARQPQAPFGELFPFTPGDGKSPAAPLPADPRFGTPEMAREAVLVNELRTAMRLFEEGSVREAAVIWDTIAERGEPLVQPHRLAWARARARWVSEELIEAEEILAGLDAENTPFDVRANGLVARASILDRLGRRQAAIEAYTRAQAYLEANSEYNDGLISPLRKRIAEGLKSPQGGKPMPGFPGLQRIPG